MGHIVLTVGALMVAAAVTLPSLGDTLIPRGGYLLLRIGGIALVLLGLIVRRQGPTAWDFPPGTQFLIKEFDVPLAFIPGKGWFNWFGGAPRAYDEDSLRVDNNWESDSFEEWLGVVEASRSGMRRIL